MSYKITCRIGSEWKDIREASSLKYAKDLAVAHAKEFGSRLYRITSGTKIWSGIPEKSKIGLIMRWSQN